MRRKGEPLETQEDLRAYIPYLVNRLSNRLGADQNKLLAEHGLNNAALRTLSVLHIYGKLTVNDISVLAVIEQSTASRTIDALLSAGLVTRELGEADQRRREVSMTPHGEILLRRIWPVVERNYERLVEGVKPDEIRLCAAVLSRMIDNVRKHPL
ncbi:MAG: MarR family transcriptional regulator [Hyphomicrobiales bacterium]|nr:MarR family transcriptional regulator [Hyphomicrobiales bacterium]